MANEKQEYMCMCVNVCVCESQGGRRGGRSSITALSQQGASNLCAGRNIRSKPEVDVSRSQQLRN